MEAVDLSSKPLDAATLDFATSPLAASSLLRPVRHLAEELNTLVHNGHLQGVELDLTHVDNPCFLLRVALDAPQFYVELFVNEPFFDEMFEEDETFEDEEGENGDMTAEAAMPLNVLMNWMNSDTEPTFWQTGFNPLDDASPEVDFTELVALILSLTETLPKTEELPKIDPRLIPKAQK